MATQSVTSVTTVVTMDSINGDHDSSRTVSTKLWHNKGLRNSQGKYDPNTPTGLKFNPNVDPSHGQNSFHGRLTAAPPAVISESLPGHRSDIKNQIQAGREAVMKTAVASADKLGQYPDAGMRPGLLPSSNIYQILFDAKICKSAFGEREIERWREKKTTLLANRPTHVSVRQQRQMVESLPWSDTVTRHSVLLNW